MNNLKTYINRLLPMNSSDNKIQISFIRISLVIGFSVVFIIGLYNIFILKNYNRGFYDLVSSLSFVFCFIILFFNRGYNLCTFILLSGFMISSWISLITISYFGPAKYYTLSFPVMVFFLNTRKKGIIWVTIFVIGEIIIILLAKLSVITFQVDFIEVYLRLFNIIVIAIISYFISYRHDLIQKRLYNLAYEDSLTLLPNRNSLLRDINKNIVLVGIINLDDLKEINAILGYDSGDLVLKKVSSILQSFSDTFDFKVYRLSGSELAIIKYRNKFLPLEELQNICKKIQLKIVKETMIIGKQRIKIHTTIGIGYHFDEYESLLHHADLALKQSKQNHLPFSIIHNVNNAVKIYEDFLHISDLIHKGLDDDRIFPYFQPIYSNRTGKIEKYEALVRLSDDKGVIYSPQTFLDCAKRIKLYTKITKIVLTKVIKLLKVTEHKFSVNISYDDLLDPLTSKFIILLIQQNITLSHRITFEILESESLENRDVVNDFINIVTDMGCKVAIDDFGSGYSNFDYLIHYNFNFIKIDGSLIKNIDTDIESEKIVTNIINFAKHRDIKTIAEYVHSESVYNKVIDLGIDYSQGFHLGEPGFIET